MRFRNLKIPLLLIALIKLTGCGYHSLNSDEKPTLSIPYVKGDRQGLFTAELSKQLNQSGAYELLSEQGDLVLTVQLIDRDNKVVGFRYDRSEITGKIEKNLMAAENQASVMAKVSLHRSSGEVAIESFTVVAFSNYDYNDVNSLRELSFITSSGKREKVITYSLGQLDSVEGGADNALRPIYQQLARKIVDRLQQDPQDSTFLDG